MKLLINKLKMHFNNFKLINHAFEVLKVEEAKINYYYEPRFYKKIKDGKDILILMN